MYDKEIFKIIKQNKRRERIRNILSKSKIIWILDPYPFETHQIHPRSVAENYRRDQIRQEYSWHNIARLQNEKVFKAGLAGIVTAPIMAGLYINRPESIHLNFPIQMAFIYLSGFLYVLASAILNLRVPIFVKKFLATDLENKHRVLPRLECKSSISLEFLKLGRTIEVTPENVGDLAPNSMECRTASIVLGQGGACYKVGFDTLAQANIEIFLYRLAEKHNFTIYEEYKMDDGEVGLQERNGPTTVLSSRQIYIQHLKIEKVKNHYVAALSHDRISGAYKDRDIVIEFYDPRILLNEQLDSELEVQPYTHGLDNILNEDYMNTITEELSYWQAWQRPFSRVLSLWIFRFSLISFVLFLILQGWVVWKAVSIAG